MTYRPAPVPPGAVPARAIEARLEPDAIGMAQDTVIGMASSAPAGTMAATVAALAVASAYGSGPVLVLTALPMLVIVNSYRRLNLWSPDCGASFEWVGRAINPYLGLSTGWLMIAGYVIGTVAEVVVLGPSVLAVSGSSSADAWASIGIDTALCLIMLAIAGAGLRITARTQIGMVAAEYLILIIFSAAGLLAVLGRRRFLGWIIVKSVQNEPASQRWSLAGIVAADVIVVGYARFVLRSAFFQIPRERA